MKRYDISIQPAVYLYLLLLFFIAAVYLHSIYLLSNFRSFIISIKCSLRYIKYNFRINTADNFTNKFNHKLANLP